MTDDLDTAIRGMLADELVGPALKGYFGSPCTALAKKIRVGFDRNPRTMAAILIIRRLLEEAAAKLPDPLED